jgi:hypothetical protein
MMGGIAGAPGAATAAQPKMMAAGGIVAFAGGGDTMGTPSLEQQELSSQAAELSSDEKRKAKLIAELEQKLDFLTRAGAPQAAEVRAQLEAVKASRDGVTPAAPAASAAPAAPAAPADNRTLLNQADAPLRAQPLAAPRPPDSGLPGLSGAQTAPSTVPRPAAPAPTDPLAEALRKQSIEGMNIDPAAGRLSEETRVQDKLSFPEEQARRRAAIDAQRKMYEQEFDPERQRREGLKQFLINAGGRRYGEFAGGAKGAMGYDKEQSTARQTRLKGLEDMEQGLFGLKKSAVEGGIGAGKSAFEQGSILKRQGMDTGSRVYGTDVESRDRALGREIERLKVGAQNEANKIQREGLDLSRAQTLYSTTVNRMQQLERKLDEDFAAANGMLLMAQQSGKMDKAQQQQLEIAQLELQRQKAELRKEMEPVLGPIRQKLGANTMTGATPEDRALVERFLNK